MSREIAGNINPLVPTDTIFTQVFYVCHDDKGFQGPREWTFISVNSSRAQNEHYQCHFISGACCNNR